MNPIRLAIVVVAMSMLQSAALSQEAQDPKVLAAENKLLQAQVKSQQDQIDTLKMQMGLLQEKLKALGGGPAPADPTATAVKTPGQPTSAKATTQPVDVLPIVTKLVNQCITIERSNATQLRKADLLTQAYSEAIKSFGEIGSLKARVAEVGEVSGQTAFAIETIGNGFLCTILLVDIPKDEAVAINRGTSIALFGRFSVGEDSNGGWQRRPMLVVSSTLSFHLLVYCEDCSIAIGGKHYSAKIGDRYSISGRH